MMNFRQCFNFFSVKKGNKIAPLPFESHMLDQTAASSRATEVVSLTPSISHPKIYHGLEEVLIAETILSNVDGEKGELIYAGFTLEEIISKKYSYEDVFYLLLKNEFPKTDEDRIEFSLALANQRVLPEVISQWIECLPYNLDYIDVLRTGISMLGSEIDISWPPTEKQAISMVSKAPMILCQYHQKQMKLGRIEPLRELSHVANFYYMLTGERPEISDNAARIRALEVYFISTIEHGMSASTFAARVCTSTEADMVSAIVAAISTLKGPLHGGAPSKVAKMLNEICTIENAEPWLRTTMSDRKRIMGFGHRVYKVKDPRATILQAAVAGLPETIDKQQLMLSLKVEEIAVRLFQARKQKALYPNIEFGAAVLLSAIGLEKELYPATFAISLIGGWCPHILEHSRHNRLMRPTALYMGISPADRKINHKVEVQISAADTIISENKIKL